MSIKLKAIHFLAMLMGLIAASISYQVGAEDDFGRLFSRPTERKNLDYLRQNQPLKIVKPQEELPQDELVEMSPPELPDPIKLQGYVKRSDGKKSTLWINNQPVQEDSVIDNVNIGRLSGRSNNSAEGLEVKIPANGKRLRLKAGQVYDPETNQIKELKTLEKEKQLYLEETGIVGDEAQLP
jgi:hypothetical protein